MTRISTEVNIVVRSGRRNTDFTPMGCADPGMQRNPPAPEALGIDERVSFPAKFRLGRPLDDNIAFPCAIVLGLPMLNRATAANAKMRAKRRDPLRAGALDREQAAAVGMTGYGGNLHPLAAEPGPHV